MTTTPKQALTPWGLTRLTEYGTPSIIDGEPVAVDPATQMAVWKTSDGTFTHTAKHRQTYRHSPTSTSRSTDSSKNGDTQSDSDTNSSVD